MSVKAKVSVIMTEEKNTDFFRQTKCRKNLL